VINVQVRIYQKIQIAMKIKSKSGLIPRPSEPETEIPTEQTLLDTSGLCPWVVHYVLIIFGFCLILIYAINLFAYEELIQKHNDENKLLYKQLISQLIYLNKQDSIIAVKDKDIDYLKVRVERLRNSKKH